MKQNICRKVTANTYNLFEVTVDFARMDTNEHGWDNMTTDGSLSRFIRNMICRIDRIKAYDNADGTYHKSLIIYTTMMASVQSRSNLN